MEFLEAINGDKHFLEIALALAIVLNATFSLIVLSLYDKKCHNDAEKHHPLPCKLRYVVLCSKLLCE